MNERGLSVGMEMIANNFRAFVGNTPIFVLPFNLPSAVIGDDNMLGVQWDDIHGWSPADAEGALIGAWARPPYPTTMLVGKDNASMIGVRAVGRDSSGRWRVCFGGNHISRGEISPGWWRRIIAYWSD